MDEKATSSSRKGAIPVHSESRQPRISSSSAISSSRCVCSRTCLLQLLLQRVAVHAVVVAVELVDEFLDLEDRLARNDPERLGFAAAAVELLCVGFGEGAVRRVERAGVLERLAFALLPENLVDHQA